jgi:RND superfamily putative drug exporter
MASLLYRLGRTAYRRWPFFIAGWLLLVVAIGGVAGTLSKPMSNSFSIPGIESVEAAQLQGELFGGEGASMDQASASIVVAAPTGHTLTEKPYADAVAGLVSGLKRVDSVPQTIAGPVEVAKALEAQGADPATVPLSRDDRVGTIDFALDVPTVADVKPATQQAIFDVMDKARDAGLTVEASGPALQVASAAGASAELIGIAIALLILAMTFGSLVAAGLPIVTAGIGVGLGMSGITAMTAFTSIDASTPMLATMIGLAVGIDYALFILARYRSELDHTDDRAEAMGLAVGTAGSAVVFAGLTVVIALAALSVVGIPFLAAMGWGAAATVIIAVLVALTLLPAVLGMLKGKAFGGRFRRYVPARDTDGKVLNHGVRWARLVGKAPVVVVLLVVVGLGALAVPMKNLHLALPSDSTAAADTTQRKASDLVTEAFGAGRLAPMLLVVDGRDLADGADRAAAYKQVEDWARSQDDVARVQTMATNDKGAMILLEPATGPEDVATENLLGALRDGESAIEAKTGTHVGVTGTTAIGTDVSHKLSSAMPIYLGIVIGLAFLLLMLVFRSLLVPLTATLGFLLSVLGTLGATVAVFQEGAFGWFAPQPIISFMPIFLIGVVFGLAMDYQVFLVTRMREAHVHGASAREAVVDGFRSSARVVTAAALIMTAVFSGFIMMDDVIVKSMGFALAVAVLLDAFVVRMCLIPALMYLMGEKAWYLPKWLDRILPNVDVEGEGLQRPRRPVGMGAGDGGDDLDADELELVSV